MKISIIIGTYNAAKTLENCLSSIVGQTSDAWEILVSDGASEDETVPILQRNSQHLTHLNVAPDKGVYDAWNSVIPFAEGEWLMFLGADDQLASATTIAQIIDLIEAGGIAPSNCDFIYGATDLVDGEAVVERLGVADIKGGHIARDDEAVFAHTGLLHSKAVLEDLGLFDAAYLSAGDYEFLLRSVLAKRNRIRRIDMTTTRMASGGMSNSASGRKRHYDEIIHARESHNLAIPLWLKRRQAKANTLALGAKLLDDQQMTTAANLYRKIRGKPQRGSL